MPVPEGPIHEIYIFYIQRGPKYASYMVLNPTSLKYVIHIVPST